MSKDELIAFINERLAKYAPLFEVTRIKIKKTILGTKSTVAMLHKCVTWLKAFEKQSADLRRLWNSATPEYWIAATRDAQHLTEVKMLRSMVKSLKDRIDPAPVLLKVYKNIKKHTKEEKDTVDGPRDDTAAAPDDCETQRPTGTDE